MARRLKTGLKISSILLLWTLIFFSTQPLYASNSTPPKVVVLDADDLFFEMDRFKLKAMESLYEDEKVALDQSKLENSLGQLNELGLLRKLQKKAPKKIAIVELEKRYQKKIEEQQDLVDYFCFKDLEVLTLIVEMRIPIVLLGSVANPQLIGALKHHSLLPYFSKVISRTSHNYNMTFTQICHEYHCTKDTDLWLFSSRPQVLVMLKGSHFNLGYPIFYDILQEALEYDEVLLRSEDLIKAEVDKWGLLYDFKVKSFCKFGLTRFSYLLYMIQTQVVDASSSYGNIASQLLVQHEDQGFSEDADIVTLEDSGEIGTAIFLHKI